jgi:hypothetical protein
MDEKLFELEVERAQALGSLLGMVDVVLLAHDNPGFFRMDEQVELLRIRRKDYDDADKAIRAARGAR